MDTLQILEHLVAIPTVSRDSNLQLIEFVRQFLEARRIDSRLYMDASGTKANLYASLGPVDRGGVLLSGHTDVVPVDGQEWTSDPFRLREYGGRLFGRGAADMKGFIACALRAADLASQRQLRIPLQLAFSYDEEVGCLGVRSLIEDMTGWSHKPSFCIVGEPTLLQIAIGHKGKAAIKATCRGLVAHSARPDEGLNAIYLASDLIGGLRNRQKTIERDGPRDLGYEVPYTTLHVGTIRGGTALNIVPGHCEIDLEIRNVVADDPARYVQGIRQDAAEILATAQRGRAIGDIRIEIVNEYPGLDTAENAEVVGLVAALTGNRKCVKVDFGSEGGLYSGRVGIPTVVCGPGSINQAHKPDEFIAMEQLDRCDAMMAALVDRLT